MTVKTRSSDGLAPVRRACAAAFDASISGRKWILRQARDQSCRLTSAYRVTAGPTIVLFPARGPSGAALLRMYQLVVHLRALGWQPVLVPWKVSLAGRHAVLRRVQPDLILMQGVRHSLNRPQLYPGYSVVMDLDDADFHLPHLADPLKEAIQAVSLVLAGSGYVARWCRTAGAPRVRVVWTGSDVSRRQRVPHGKRRKVIAWAQAQPADYVLERQFVEAFLNRLAMRRKDFTFRIYGRLPDSDPTILQGFQATGVPVEWLPKMRYQKYLASFDDAAIGLSPICPDNPFSRGKSFGKLLAYLDRKVPVLASDEADHRHFFEADTGVISNDMDHWVMAADRLLTSADARQNMADAAFDEFRTRLSSDVCARHVDRALRELLQA